MGRNNKKLELDGTIVELERMLQGARDNLSTE